MTDTRKRIEEHVRQHPGVHFTGLSTALGLANGQVQHHTRALRQDGDIVREAVAGRTHFFPPGYDAADRRALALLRRETPRDVVRQLQAGTSRPAATADALGISRSTLEHHVDRMRSAGVVEKHRDDGRVRLVLVDPDRVERLLDAAAPSRTERAVSRFTSLVDDALDG